MLCNLESLPKRIIKNSNLVTKRETNDPSTAWLGTALHVHLAKLLIFTGSSSNLSDGKRLDILCYTSALLVIYIINQMIITLKWSFKNVKLFLLFNFPLLYGFSCTLLHFFKFFSLKENSRVMDVLLNNIVYCHYSAAVYGWIGVAHSFSCIECHAGLETNGRMANILYSLYKDASRPLMVSCIKKRNKTKQNKKLLVSRISPSKIVLNKVLRKKNDKKETKYFVLKVEH